MIPKPLEITIYNDTIELCLPYMFIFYNHNKDFITATTDFPIKCIEIPNKFQLNRANNLLKLMRLRGVYRGHLQSPKVNQVKKDLRSVGIRLI